MLQAFSIPSLLIQRVNASLNFHGRSLNYSSVPSLWLMTPSLPTSAHILTLIVLADGQLLSI